MSNPIIHGLHFLVISTVNSTSLDDGFVYPSLKKMNVLTLLFCLHILVFIAFEGITAQRKKLEEF